MNGVTPPACPEFELPLRLYAAGTLGEDDKVRLAGHLARCQACCEELAWLYSLRDALCQALSPDPSAQVSLEHIFHSVVHEDCATPSPQAAPSDGPLPELQKLRDALEPSRALGMLKGIFDFRKLKMDLEVGPLVVSIL